MQINIPQSEVDSLLSQVKASMENCGFHPKTVEGTRIIVIHPENWEVSLLVPYQNTKAAPTRKEIENILFNMCGVEPNCCDYFGKQKRKESYEWYFRHPNIPMDIYERLEMEIEEELGTEIGLGLPSPSGIKSNSDTAFITIHEAFFNAIAKGDKKKEYRNLNQYYCDKFFAPGIKKKFIKINNGYKTGKENQMVLEIKEILLVSEDGREISTFDKGGKLITSFGQLPNHFAPAAYCIVLGNRIS